MRIPARAAILCALILAAPPATAGPWTEPPGERFVARSGGLDPGGPTGLRRDLHYAFGWREGTTVGMDLSRQHDLRGGDFRGRAEVFLRQRVWQDGEGTVAALQAEAGGGLGGAADAPDLAGRLLVGRGYATRWGDGWSEAGIGWRAETDDSSDRLVASAATGLRPAPGWLAMAGAEADLRADRATPDWEVLRLTATVARRVSRGLRVYLRAEAPVWGRREVEGLDLRIGLWREF